MKSGRRKKLASGGDTSSNKFLQWKGKPEPGLEGVYPEKYFLPGGSSKAASVISRILPHQKPGAYRASDAKRKAEEMRKRVKEADAKKDKLSASSGPYVKKTVGSRPQSDELGDKFEYRKGGSVKSSTSRRADGVAQRGKTRGKFI